MAGIHLAPKHKPSNIHNYFFWVMLQSAGHREADCCSMHANLDLAMLQSDGHTEAHHYGVRTDSHWARLQFDGHTNPDDCSMPVS